MSLRSLSFLFLLLPLALPAQTQRIRIVAANTTSGNGQSYQDPGIRIFQGLQPDIVLIQEFNYLSNTTADIRALVDTAFGSTFHYYREGGAQIPNGIISRYPIIASGEWTDPRVSNRDFAWARIDIPGDKDLWAISVHFLTANAGERNLEAQALVSYINANVPTSDYLVIGGDFNTDSRTESCITTLRQLVTNANTPVDQNGNDDTNAGRNKPYDWVMPDNDLNQYITPVVLGAVSMPNGLVFDSRVFNPLSAVSPVLRNDSGASSMQHMAIVKDFLVPTGGTATPTPTPNPTTTATPTPTGATPTPPPPTSDGEVFINEIHYDDAGEDADEGVEIAGPAGTNLTGWKVIAYNGSGGAQYAEVTLSTTLAGQQGCMGTVWVPISGLQNGAPDGIALANAQGGLVQFLSYEGTFNASGGPANGQLSVDIGVSETNDTADGTSMQLQGTGNKASHFTWATAIGHTRGLPNTGQTFANCATTPSPTPTPFPGAIWSVR